MGTWPVATFHTEEPEPPTIVAGLIVAATPTGAPEMLTATSELKPRSGDTVTV